MKEYPHPIALVEAIDENALAEGKKYYGPVIFYSRNIIWKEFKYYNAWWFNITSKIRITEFHAASSELKALVREFRSHALDFLDLLDSKLPIVAKLKVSLEWA